MNAIGCGWIVFGLVGVGGGVGWVEWGVGSGLGRIFGESEGPHGGVISVIGPV